MTAHHFPQGKADALTAGSAQPQEVENQTTDHSSVKGWLAPFSQPSHACPVCKGTGIERHQYEAGWTAGACPNCEPEDADVVGWTNADWATERHPNGKWYAYSTLDFWRGFEGEGPTEQAAIHDLRDQIEDAISEEYTPHNGVYLR